MSQTITESQGHCLICRDIETRDWFAWNNQMPPKPDDFHVAGEIQVANPGVEPVLVYRVPQGINPQILMLDLILFQHPGVWPEVLTWKQVRYDRVMMNCDYEHVQIFCEGDEIAAIKVQIVQ